MPYLVKEQGRAADQTDRSGTRITWSHYKIPNAETLAQSGGLSSVFENLCILKEQHKSILDFSVTRSSLE